MKQKTRRKMFTLLYEQVAHAKRSAKRKAKKQANREIAEQQRLAGQKKREEEKAERAAKEAAKEEESYKQLLSIPYRIWMYGPLAMRDLVTDTEISRNKIRQMLFALQKSRYIFSYRSSDPLSQYSIEFWRATPKLHAFYSKPKQAA